MPGFGVVVGDYWLRPEPEQAEISGYQTASTEARCIGCTDRAAVQAKCLRMTRRRLTTNVRPRERDTSQMHCRSRISRERQIQVLASSMSRYIGLKKMDELEAVGDPDLRETSSGRAWPLSMNAALRYACTPSRPKVNAVCRPRILIDCD